MGALWPLSGLTPRPVVPAPPARTPPVLLLAPAPAAVPVGQGLDMRGRGRGLGVALVTAEVVSLCSAHLGKSCIPGREQGSATAELSLGGEMGTGTPRHCLNTAPSTAHRGHCATAHLQAGHPGRLHLDLLPQSLALGKEPLVLPRVKQGWGSPWHCPARAHSSATLTSSCRPSACEDKLRCSFSWGSTRL